MIYLPFYIYVRVAIIRMMAGSEGELLSNGETPPEFTSRVKLLEKQILTPGTTLHVDSLLVTTLSVRNVGLESV